MLLKPTAGYSLAHPVTTSRQTLEMVINSIRRVSDADIIILEGTPTGDSIQPIYRALAYDFPRVLMLDVKDCIWVEVENPLSHPLAVPTFWVPNIVLSSDFLISIAPFKVMGNRGGFSIMNLLSLLPVSKYRSGATGGWGTLYALGIDKVLADLYFTIPFDLGIVEARQKFVSRNGTTQGEVEDYGKIFIGEPFEVDNEVSETLGLKIDYLDFIKVARVEFES